MPHIHTESGQHDHTITAFIVRTNGTEPMALLHMHKKLNKLLPVGGHIELDETPWQTARHELMEEAGYEIDKLKILQPKSRIKTLSKATLHPYPVSINTHDVTAEHNHTDIAYAFAAIDDPSQEIAENESSDLRWLTQRELNDLGENDIYRNVQEIYNFIFNECLSTWELIDTASFRT